MLLTRRTAIEASEAVQLFVERARRRAADFVLDASSLPAVGEICRRLDGIPLAIELAAARVVAMSPREIAALLDERFRLLTGGRRTAVERHQTLRATVDWSYSLLGARERTVFDRLGVFAGSFDAAAAEAIAAGESIEPWDVLDALTDLVAKSMVVRNEPPTATRYQCSRPCGRMRESASTTRRTATGGGGFTPSTTRDSPSKPDSASRALMSSYGEPGCTRSLTTSERP